MSDKPHIPLVYVARHGETTLNGNDCFRGKMDVELNGNGRRDAHKLAHYFEPIEVCEIVTSDRIRAEETANIIGQRKKITPFATPALRAWNVGMFSGKPKTKENQDLLDEYIQNPDRVIPEGESLNQFKARIRPAITDAIDIADNRGEPILLVSHSSVIHEVGSMYHGDHNAVLVEPGGAIMVYATENGIAACPIYKTREESSRRADTIS